MVKVPQRRQQNNILRIPDAQWNWIGTKEGELVIVQDDEGKHGRFISIYPPTKKEDKQLIQDNNKT